MNDYINWGWLFVASWLAATVSGAAGFGGALILLPLLVNTVGPKAAVPLLTIAQLLGNLSRVWFGRQEISWKPVGYFVLGAIPFSIIGARLFVKLPNDIILIGIGFLLIGIVIMKRLINNNIEVATKWFIPAGALVGFLSAVVGSAGPLGAAIFLGLNLPPVSYVASEAVTAVSMHVTKIVVYKKYTLIGQGELIQGAFLGVAMILGSWTGKKIIEKIPRETFRIFVEVLLLLSAVQLIFLNIK